MADTTRIGERALRRPRFALRTRTGATWWVLVALGGTCLALAPAAHATTCAGITTAGGLVTAFADCGTTPISLGASVTTGQLAVPPAGVILDLQGFTLTAIGASNGGSGIYLPVGSSLTVQDVVGGGSLVATGGAGAAGIGGDADYFGPTDAGDLTVLSGTVIATGGAGDASGNFGRGGGAGIGGGTSTAAVSNAGHGAKVILRGGTIQATGGAGAGAVFPGGGGAGIGGGGNVGGAGGNGGAGDDVLVTGGHLSAVGGDRGATMGGNTCSRNGGAGAGIGGGGAGGNACANPSGGTAGALSVDSVAVVTATPGTPGPTEFNGAQAIASVLPDLSLTLGDSTGAAVNTGDVYTYIATAAVEPSGGTETAALSLTVTLPAGVTTTGPAAGTGWTCSTGTGLSAVTCTLPAAIRGAGATLAPVSIPAAVAVTATGALRAAATIADAANASATAENIITVIKATPGPAGPPGPQGPPGRSGRHHHHHHHHHRVWNDQVSGPATPVG